MIFLNPSRADIELTHITMAEFPQFELTASRNSSAFLSQAILTWGWSFRIHHSRRIYPDKSVEDDSSVRRSWKIHSIVYLILK